MILNKIFFTCHNTSSDHNVHKFAHILFEALEEISILQFTLHTFSSTCISNPWRDHSLKSAMKTKGI